MNTTSLSPSNYPGRSTSDRYQAYVSVTSGTTSNAIVGFDRNMAPNVKISGGTLYATFAEPSEIAASSSVSDAIWEDITASVTAGVTAQLIPGVTGLVLVAGASDRTIRVTG